MIRTVGILGAGKLGTVLGQLAIKSGYKVLIAGSGSPDKIALSVKVLTPGAVAMQAIDVARQSDLVILALPLSKYKNIPQKELAGKVVIDAMNYWWEVDGDRDVFIDPDVSSSEAVQQFLNQSHVVKAISHMGYHDLHDEAVQNDSLNRKAIAIAGDDEKSVEIVSEVVNKLGFDPLPIGSLSEGVRLEPGSQVFGANLDKKSLSEILKL